MLAFTVFIGETALDEQVGREMYPLCVRSFDVQPEGTPAYRALPKFKEGYLFEDPSSTLISIANDQVGILTKLIAREASASSSA